MPKSAKDDLIARIDADIAKFEGIRDFAQGVNERNGDIQAAAEGEADRLRGMRDYVTAQVPKAAATEPKKRGRKLKRGLPDTPSNGD